MQEVQACFATLSCQMMRHIPYPHGKHCSRLLDAFALINESRFYQIQ